MRTQNTNMQVETNKEPKRLSKWGIWRRNPDRRTIVIMDMKAVLK